MKNSLSILLMICLFCLYSCHDSLEVTGCLEDKFEEFKQDPWAESIVKINKPGEPLYWFIDTVADGVEEVLNEECELICIADCDCTGLGLCDASHLDYPRETIWEK